MDLSQDALLPILLLTIVANIAIVTVLLASGRLGRGKQVATATTHASGFESTIMSSSYDDHATDTWVEPIATAPTNGHEAIAATEDLPAHDDIVTVPVAVPAPEAVALAGGPDSDAAERGIDALTGLPDASAFHRLVADEDARIARYHRPATVVIFELDGLERLTERLGRTPPTASCRRWPTRSAGSPATPTRSPASDPAGSRRCCPRPTRSPRSTTSSASGAPASCGWSRARSRSTSPSAGPARTGDPTLTEVQRIATERMYTELRRAAGAACRTTPAT